MPAFQKIYKILSRRLRFFVQHIGATSLIDFNKLKKSKFFSKPTLFYFPSQKTMKTFCYSLIILAACLTSASPSSSTPYHAICGVISVVCGPPDPILGWAQLTDVKQAVAMIKE